MTVNKIYDQIMDAIINFRGKSPRAEMPSRLYLGRAQAKGLALWLTQNGCEDMVTSDNDIATFQGSRIYRVNADDHLFVA